jgi:hypothetical protein
MTTTRGLCNIQQISPSHPRIEDLDGTYKEMTSPRTNKGDLLPIKDSWQVHVRNRRLVAEKSQRSIRAKTTDSESAKINLDPYPIGNITLTDTAVRPETLGTRDSRYAMPTSSVPILTKKMWFEELTR